MGRSANGVRLLARGSVTGACANVAARRARAGTEGRAGVWARLRCVGFVQVRLLRTKMNTIPSPSMSLTLMFGLASLSLVESSSGLDQARPRREDKPGWATLGQAKPVSASQARPSHSHEYS